MQQILRKSLPVALITSTLCIAHIPNAAAVAETIWITAECAAYGPQAGSYIQCQGPLKNGPYNFFGSNGARFNFDPYQITDEALTKRACQEIYSNSNIRFIKDPVRVNGIIKIFDGKKVQGKTDLLVYKQVSFNCVGNGDTIVTIPKPKR